MKKVSIFVIVVALLIACDMSAAAGKGKVSAKSQGIDVVFKAKPEVQKQFALYLYFRAQPLILESQYGVPTAGVTAVHQMATFASTQCMFAKDKEIKEAIRALEMQLNTFAYAGATPENMAERQPAKDPKEVALGKLGILQIYYLQLLMQIEDRVIQLSDIFQITLPERLIPQQGARKASTKAGEGQATYL